MAPRPDLLTPLGLQMIETLPPFLRDDPDTIAVLHCYAKEWERFEGVVEETRRQFNPLTAGTWGLTVMERVLRIPHDPAATLEVQREGVLRRLRAVENDPAGHAWVTRVGRRIGDVPWTYEEHIPGDAASPPVQTLRIALPFAPTDQSWTNAVRAFREETPSELELTFTSSGGFILDASEMDTETMAV